MPNKTLCAVLIDIRVRIFEDSHSVRLPIYSQCSSERVRVPSAPLFHGAVAHLVERDTERFVGPDDKLSDPAYLVVAQEVPMSADRARHGSFVSLTVRRKFTLCQLEGRVSHLMNHAGPLPQDSSSCV